MLTQTLNEIEIIVINDGSTDGTLGVLKQYSKDDRLHIHTQKNSGVSVARNNGISLSKGEYIAFVDADDYVEPDMYEKLIKKAKTNDYDVVCTGYLKHFLVFQKAVGLHFEKPLPDKNTVEKELLLPLLLAHNKGLETIQECWCKLFKRSIFTEHSWICFPYDMNFGEDITFIARVFSIASSVAFVNESLYHYRRFLTAGTLSTKQRLDGYIQTIKWRKYLKEIAERFPVGSEIYESQQTSPEGKVARGERFAIKLIQENDIELPEVFKCLKDIFQDKTYREGIISFNSTDLPNERLLQKTAVLSEDFSLWLETMINLAKSTPLQRKKLTEWLRSFFQHFIR